MKNQACCFIGHRKINETEDLKIRLWNLIEDLIINKNVNTFLLGSKSEFIELCVNTLTQIKEKYPHINRVYVRAEYPDINQQYKNYLLQSFDETYFSEKLANAQSTVYVQRNYEMIDKSDFCIFYCNEQLFPTTRKSGTKIALDYALKKKKIIYNLADK